MFEIFSHKIYRVTILAIVVVFPVFSGYSQEFKFVYEDITTEVVRIEKGLSQNSVRCIFQDREGFMWFGTWAGLNRYDGLKFDVFLPDIGENTISISNQTVNAILQSDDGNIWVGTESGISVLNPTTFEVTNHNNIGNRGQNNYRDTITSLELINGNIWIGTQDGITIFNTKLQKFITPKFQQNDKIVALKAAIRDIEKGRGSEVWLATDKGILCVDSKTHAVLHYFVEGTISSNLSLTLLNYKDSVLLIGTEAGLNILNLSDYKNRIIRAGKANGDLKNEIVMDLMEDKDGNLWVATSGGGAFIFHIDANKFEQVETHYINDSKAESLGNEYIYSLHQSHDGTIWIGTAWGGLKKVMREAYLFKGFNKKVDNSTGLNNNRIWAFCEKDDQLYIGTDGGINIYNKSTHKFAYINTKSPKGKELNSDNVRSLFIDSRGNIWAGTFESGLNKIDGVTQKTTFYTQNSIDPKLRVASNTIWNIAEDGRKKLWLSTHDGLQVIDITTGSSKIYRNNPADSTSLPSNVVYNVNFDLQGNAWVSTYNGLCLYQPKTDNFKIYRHIIGDNKSLTTNKIFTVYQDIPGSLWIGTIGGGLNHMDTRTGKVENYTTHNGLPDNVVYAIVDDKIGNIWMSTNYGISSFNLRNKGFVNYSVTDGLLSNEFNFGADHIDADTNIYFGGMFGFTVFKPKEVKKYDNPPKISVSSLEIANHSTLYMVSDKQVFDLNYKQNDFQIRISMLDFVNPLKNVFSYKIKELDADWRQINSNYPIISYSNLNPGRYTLLIKGVNSSGIWMERPFRITFIINEPWYNTLIFKIALFIFAILIAAFLVRRRIVSLRMKHAAEKQLLELEKQALRLQMNPHFIFNTLNSIQSYVLKNDIDQSISYLSRFSKLMRKLLASSRETHIPLSTEIEIIQNYVELEKLRLENNFDFKINIDPAIDTEFIGISPLILQPFVENAIIHGLLPKTGEANMLTINLINLDKFIKIEIIDNGVGRGFYKDKPTANPDHKPSGILITQKRLELINKVKDSESNVSVVDLFNEDGTAAGTKVQIVIKIIELE